MTDLTDLPKNERQTALQAIKAAQRGLTLEVVYDGAPRVVEVHSVGISTAGKPCMRVYQTQGAPDSRTGSSEGWRLMTLSKVERPHFLDIKSAAPREGYRRGDLGMSTIFAEV